MVGRAMSGSEGAALAIDVVSDVICPWCYIGKRRLEQALAQTDLPVVVRWRPYQLDPTIPPDGKSRHEYMQAKFGSPERIRQFHERLQEAGEAEGIRFAFDRIAVSPNTLNAHRVIRWAGESGVQDAVVEALFRAYFVEGSDIGRADVLAGIAEAAGMTGTHVEARLASDLDREEVSREVESARSAGVSGVPTFILAGRYAVVGAQPSEVVADALKSVSARTSGELAAAAAFA